MTDEQTEDAAMKLLRAIYEEHPNASKSELEKLFLKAARGDEAVLDAASKFLFNKLTAH